jgi:hypothetical protein
MPPDFSSEMFEGGWNHFFHDIIRAAEGGESEDQEDVLTSGSEDNDNNGT